MQAMRRSPTFLCAIVAVLGGCTPPRVYLEGYEPPPVRGGLANEGTTRGVLAGRSGAASAPSGIALFASQQQMYQALAEMVGGPISQGVQTYRGFEVTTNPTTNEQARALETLQSIATRSARASARREGDVLVNVAFNRGPPDPDGAFLIRITSLLESPAGVRHREVRDAVVRPRGAGQTYDMKWLGPPRLELRRD